MTRKNDASLKTLTGTIGGIAALALLVAGAAVASKQDSAEASEVRNSAFPTPNS